MTFNLNYYLKNLYAENSINYYSAFAIYLSLFILFIISIFISGKYRNEKNINNIEEELVDERL